MSAPRHRTLRFHTLDDVTAEARRLVAGGCTMTGRWSLAQILEHLARAYELAFVDASEMRVPWLLRAAVRAVMTVRPQLILDRPMATGFKLPQRAARLIPGEDVTDAAAALEHLQQVVERYQRGEALRPHPVLGRLTPEQWTKINLRHAEMHLSFAQPK